MKFSSAEYRVEPLDDNLVCDTCVKPYPKTLSCDSSVGFLAVTFVWDPKVGPVVVTLSWTLRWDPWMGFKHCINPRQTGIIHEIELLKLLLMRIEEHREVVRKNFGKFTGKHHLCGCLFFNKKATPWQVF